ncbi:MAG: riboflavin synthase [Phycisphaerae bacterium]|nr:riboflavin synthase [Phycisphaerae bacterium]
MFTGIIERTAPIAQIEDQGRSRRITIAPPWSDVRLGESVAINGVCLTVAAIDGARLAFDVIPETLSITNLRKLREGDRVNLERSLRAGDRIDGHFVQGHVDGVAKVIEIRRDAGEYRIIADAPPQLAKYLVPKGSICLEGTSLTIATVRRNRFEVALIPTTLSITTFGSIQPGWPLNMEADIFAKTIVNTLERVREMQNDE